MTRDAESAVKNQLEKIEHVAEVDSVANVDMRVSTAATTTRFLQTSTKRLKFNLENGDSRQEARTERERRW